MRASLVIVAVVVASAFPARAESPSGVNARLVTVDPMPRNGAVIVQLDVFSFGVPTLGADLDVTVDGAAVPGALRHVTGVRAATVSAVLLIFEPTDPLQAGTVVDVEVVGIELNEPLAGRLTVSAETASEAVASPVVTVVSQLACEERRDAGSEGRLEVTLDVSTAGVVLVDVNDNATFDPATGTGSVNSFDTRLDRNDLADAIDAGTFGFGTTASVRVAVIGPTGTASAFSAPVSFTVMDDSDDDGMGDLQDLCPDEFAPAVNCEGLQPIEGGCPAEAAEGEGEGEDDDDDDDDDDGCAAGASGLWLGLLGLLRRRR